MPEPIKMPKPAVRVVLDGLQYDVIVGVNIRPVPAKPPGQLVEMPDRGDHESSN